MQLNLMWRVRWIGQTNGENKRDQIHKQHTHTHTYRLRERERTGDSVNFITRDNVHFKTLHLIFIYTHSTDRQFWFGYHDAVTYNYRIYAFSDTNSNERISSK